MKTKLIHLTVLALSLSLAQQLRAQGGSLTPPPGAPAPVMRTLDEIYNKTAAVETQVTTQAPQITTIETKVGQLQNRTPVNTLPGNASATHVISLPGHYYLTGGITGTSTKSGIRVDAANVTIDLNGFPLEAVAGCTKGIEIYSAGPILIRNGSLRWWPQQAIWSSGNAEITVQDMMIQDTQHRAIDVSGNAIIERVTVKTAQHAGIYCNGVQPSIIRDCRVEGITSTGFSMGIRATKSIISRCTVSNVSGTSAANNANESIYGIWSDGGSVQSCIVNIITQSGAADSMGIYSHQVLDCTVVGVSNSGPEDSIGIQAEVLSRCSVSLISSTNSSVGIRWADTVE
ncbi:MAG: right-handed parallel beta-helix repeat-containing protein, partial [Verrucomicrobiaceae bacterium]|nr:right-handed parallel beta-helix repeat-containing protein [Verrucomicrobiaceae bacterium]